MRFVDSDHPDVIAFAEKATASATTDREKAVAATRKAAGGHRPHDTEWVRRCF